MQQFSAKNVFALVKTGCFHFLPTIGGRVVLDSAVHYVGLGKGLGVNVMFRGTPAQFFIQCID